MFLLGLGFLSPGRAVTGGTWLGGQRAAARPLVAVVYLGMVLVEQRVRGLAWWNLARAQGVVALRASQERAGVAAALGASGQKATGGLASLRWR